MFWQCELSSLAFEILGLIIFACRLDQCYNQFWGSVVNNTKPFAARKFQRRNHLDKLHHMPVAESTCAKKKKGIMFIFWKEPSNALGVRNNTMLWICQSDTTIRFHPRRRANENILSYLLVPVHWSIIQIRGSQKTPLQICIRIKAAFFVCSPNQAHGPLRNSGRTNLCTVQMSSSGQTPRPNPPSIFITSQD